MDHFRLFAPFYDIFMPRPDRRFWRRMLRLPTDGYLLDAGGGTGRVAGALTAEAAGVVICDVSAPMLRQSSRKSNGARPVAGAAEALPFPDGTFRRALVVDALHHFADQESALADLHRALCPGGRLVIEEPDIARFPVKLVALMERWSRMRSRFLPPEAIVAMAAGAGFHARIARRAAFRAWIIADKPAAASTSESAAPPPGPGSL